MTVTANAQEALESGRGTLDAMISWFEANKADLPTGIAVAGGIVAVMLVMRWIGAMMRHGYTGAFELAATVDYLFGYDATAGVVDDWMYEQVAAAYVGDPSVREFLRKSNPWALRGITERLLEAADRGLWAQERALFTKDMNPETPPAGITSKYGAKPPGLADFMSAVILSRIARPPRRPDAARKAGAITPRPSGRVSGKWVAMSMLPATVTASDDKATNLIAIRRAFSAVGSGSSARKARLGDQYDVHDAYGV